LEQDAMLGGVADIDLICVHSGACSAPPREVHRISDEVTLDIAHYSDTPFHQPRLLRRDVWLGSFLWKGVKVLYDSQLWFEFMHAGATSQFMSAENILGRARSLARTARELWHGLDEQAPASFTLRLSDFFQSLEDAGNAIACLSGAPLPLRRFWQQLPLRATSIGKPELAGSLQRLVTVDVPGDDLWQIWFNSWVNALDEIGQQAKCPPELQPSRRKYYVDATAWLRGENPLAALWILLRTELKTALTSRSNATMHKQVAKIGSDLGFGGDDFTGKLNALDQCLDDLESLLDDYARQNGLEG
jgi:hypothetical protein